MYAYIPHNGALSGTSFESQTEAFLSALAADVVAAQQGANTATQKADLAQQAAQRATADATAAQANATAAQQAAERAQAKADAATLAAQQAQTKADTAFAAATAAQGSANQAISAANAATATANGADRAASNAASTASSALSTANAAANASLSNLNSTGANVIKHAAMPGRGINVSLPFGGTYTAPAAGWMLYNASGDESLPSVGVGLRNTTRDMIAGGFTLGHHGMCAILPVSQGDVVESVGADVLFEHYSKFFYARG